MQFAYFVYTQSLKSDQRHPRDDRQHFSVTLTPVRRLAARCAKAAIKEAKQLGFVAPIIGEERLSA